MSLGTSARWTIALVVALPLFSVAAAAPEEEYEIGPSDLLRVVVLGQPEMSGELTVEPDGLLSFPLLGKVKASGMTPDGLKKKLEQLLGDGFLKRPQVSVIVREYRSQRVFVTGEIQRSGPYTLKGDRSLFGLLADIGNLGSDVGREVVVTRAPRAPAPPLLAEQLPESLQGRGDAAPEALPTPEVIRVNLQEFQSSASGRNLILRSGDTITIPRAAQIYVSGYVARPGAQRFYEGMTVLQALNLAGGVTERGASGRVKVVRIVNGKKIEEKAQVTDLVQAEDMLVVPERLF